MNKKNVANMSTRISYLEKNVLTFIFLMPKMLSVYVGRPYLPNEGRTQWIIERARCLKSDIRQKDRKTERGKKDIFIIVFYKILCKNEIFF